jgi:hypothetical protein
VDIGSLVGKYFVKGDRKDMNNVSDRKLTYEEFMQIANNNGYYDEMDIQLSWRLYDATADGDTEEIKKAENNYYWNNWYRSAGEFN